MKTEISKLRARGGGDEPEMCLSGLQVLQDYDIVRLLLERLLIVREKKIQS